MILLSEENKEIQIRHKDNDYNIVSIGLTMFLYLIMFFALFNITSLRHIYNYVIAFIFLLFNMFASIRVMGCGKYFMKRIDVGFYVGMITFTVLYTIAVLLTWFFIGILNMSTFIIINLLIVFAYLTVSYSTFAFATKQSRK